MRDTRRTRVILALLLVTSLTLIAVDLRGSGTDTGGLRGVANTVIGPLQRAAAGVVAPVQSFVDRLTAAGDDQSRIAALQAENDRLRTELNTSELARNRAAELDALLRVSGAGQYKTVPAQVVAVGPAQGFAWTVTIDAGSRDGIKPDLTVINGQGLVGRVLRVGTSTSTVVLLNDTTISLGARLESSMEIGIASGTGQPGSLALRMLNPLADVRTGQRLVTFGVPGGVYVSGIPVGTVSSVGGTPGQVPRVVTVTPFVNVTSLDIVGVVVEPPRTDPRDAVLNPPPSPTPMPSVTQSPTADPTVSPTGVGFPTDTASPVPTAT